MENDPKAFSSLELPFTTSSAKSHEVPLSNLFTKICPENRHEYVRLALNFRLHEFDEQVKAVRDGMSKVVPVPLLSLFSASELQAMVCGSPDIPLSLLKSVATYKGVDPNSSLIQWFWEVMEEFSNQVCFLWLGDFGNWNHNCLCFCRRDHCSLGSFGEGQDYPGPSPIFVAETLWYKFSTNTIHLITFYQKVTRAFSFSKCQDIPAR